jgi:hypothetical protein
VCCNERVWNKELRDASGAPRTVKLALSERAFKAVGGRKPEPRAECVSFLRNPWSLGENTRYLRRGRKSGGSFIISVGGLRRCIR